MMKILRILTTNPHGGMPGWVRREEQKIKHDIDRIQAAADKNEEAMRERRRIAKG